MISKGKLAELVYGKNYTGIDVGIPCELWKKVDVSIHVMNYNHDSLGRLENMVKVAISKNIELPEDLLALELADMEASDEYFYNNYCRDHEANDPWYSPEVFEEYKKKAANARNMVPRDLIIKKAKMEKKVTFRNWKCIAKTAEYHDGATALLLVDEEDGSPVATASVYLAPETIGRDDVPSDGIHRDQCYIKTWSENEGLLEALEEAGIVKKTGITVAVGPYKCYATLVDILK